MSQTALKRWDSPFGVDWSDRPELTPEMSLPKANLHRAAQNENHSSYAMLENPVALDSVAANVASDLVSMYGDFLWFVQARVANREEAQDLLQSAFVKAIEGAGSLRVPEAAVGWFYRVIQNSIVDHYRRRDIERRALETYKLEAKAENWPQEEPEDRAPCGCLNRGLSSLKPEYRELLVRVDVRGQSIRSASEALRITPNNTRVRLHRARRALRAKVVPCQGPCCMEGVGTARG